jgi:hypothetical protein
MNRVAWLEEMRLASFPNHIVKKQLKFQLILRQPGGPHPNCPFKQG